MWATRASFRAPAATKPPLCGARPSAIVEDGARSGVAWLSLVGQEPERTPDLIEEAGVVRGAGPVRRTVERVDHIVLQLLLLAAGPDPVVVREIAANADPRVVDTGFVTTVPSVVVVVEG